jgi:GNAT superfamily N-acetyltransferase
MDNKLTSGKLKVVKNNHSYWEFIRNLRNHKDIKQGFVAQEHITKEVHMEYMTRYGNQYLICLCDNIPAGFAGSVEGDIRVATHPDFLRLGVARHLISAVQEKYPASMAKVKIENQASLELFKSCGFRVKYYLLEQEPKTSGTT